jgi:t-SNARE complex subunit (syntaxin)
MGEQVKMQGEKLNIISEGVEAMKNQFENEGKVMSRSKRLAQKHKKKIIIITVVLILLIIVILLVLIFQLEKVF